MTNDELMNQAINIAIESVKNGGGPFGAVIAHNGNIIAKASNSVTLTNDPTAHAEVNAIREACSKIENFKLKDCQIYSSCEPCPMCLSAIYWAGISRIYFACNRDDAKASGFDDSYIYDQISLTPNERTIQSEEILRDQALTAFHIWQQKEDKIEY